MAASGILFGCVRGVDRRRFGSADRVTRESIPHRLHRGCIQTATGFLEPMLVKLHRVGPCRHRLLKGYVLAGGSDLGNLVRLLQDQCQRDPAWVKLNIGVQFDPRCPTRLWLDTGFVWFHAKEARLRVRDALAAAITALSRAARERGALLLPNAVRASPRQTWAECCVGDHHRIEVSDDVERQVLSNRLRDELDLLIAIAARAGADSHGVDAAGSRRLAESTAHVTARPLPVLTDRHLARVRSYFRARMGVPRLEQLDINPLDDGATPPSTGSAPSIECRFLDGQMLVATTMSHAVLLQAIALAIRRDTRRNPFPLAAPNDRGEMWRLDRRRAEAIARGLAMSTVLLEGKFPKAHTRARSTVQRVLDLVVSLDEELRILEVDAEELAPVLLGCMLRAQGIPALASETDLLRAWYRERPDGFVQRIADCVSSPASLATDTVTEANRQRFPAQVGLATRFWSGLLSSRTSHQNYPALPDSRSSRALPAKGERTVSKQSSTTQSRSRKAPKTASSGPVAHLLEELRVAPDNLSANRALRTAALSLKRRNWHDWLLGLTPSDRREIFARLGFGESIDAALDDDEWSGDWLAHAQAKLQSQFWCGLELVLRQSSKSTDEERVQRLVQGAPENMYVICVAFRRDPQDDLLRARLLILLKDAVA